MRFERTELSGPIPAPDVLSGYERILPGAAERILSMAEREASFRQQVERDAVQAEIAQNERHQAMLRDQQIKVFNSDSLGQILGVVVSLAAMGGAVFLGVNGQPWLASALVGLPLAALVKALRQRPPKDHG